MRGYLGNQARNRQKGHRNRGGGGGQRHGNEGLPVDDHVEGGEADIISPEELAASRSAMSLTVLKTKPVHELVTMAESMGLENMARQRKQDVIFSILKAHARGGEDIYGDGVLEILQDGFGFLRSADSSYLAGPDDIYVSPSQIRRFNLRTGDSISGLIRPPKDGERYFALLKVGEINFDTPESARHKLLFDKHILPAGPGPVSYRL
jgi:transcription termination factor Rho